MTRSQKERNDRLVRLLPAIQRQARRLTNRYHRPDVEDIDVVNEACRSYLERADADPTFLDQSDEEITRRCTLDGWNAVRRQQSKDWQASLEDTAWTTDNGRLEETIAADAPGPEEVVIAAELSEGVQEVVAGLKPAYRMICHSLMGGSAKADALSGIGAKKQAWAHYGPRLQRAFMALL